MLLADALYILMVLLIIGYISINFIADLERFLVIENIILAIIYCILLLEVIYSGGSWYFLTSVVASFNAGRVSRSIVTPKGEFGELAKEHIPLITLIIVIIIISFYLGIT